MVGTRGLALGVVVLLSLAAQAGAEDGPQPQRLTGATAYGVKVLLPNQAPAVAAFVDGEGTTAAAPLSFAYPEDGSIVQVGSAAARSWIAGANAQARTDLRSVSIFGGEITAEALVARTRASSRTGEESFAGTVIASLTVLGQAVEPAADLRVPLGDWGHLTLMQERAQSSDSGAVRGWVTLLDVKLDADHAALPVGTRILVGYAEASARQPKSAVTANPKPAAAVASAVAPAAAPTPVRQGGRRGLGIPPDMLRPGTIGPSPLVQIAPKVTKRLTAAGYVFPVYGPSGFGDTFGAPRAATIWHHGEDIFAALGAPVLAVADGTLFLVGRNTVGGNRLWLRDRDGNEFYYAHLAAFSPLAIDGGRVEAGDVIGFVGNTGDAESTPYHLHFEIHPSSLLFLGYDGVVNPYPYLRAWQHLTDVEFPSAAVWAPTVRATGRAPAAGAILLQSSDISQASGLDPGSLARAIAPAGGGRGVARELQSGRRATP
ncbi:MAG TPA: M23 family metallopeptidase [Gaiellaceae bacterium]|nr:M23 family metallopeptidase [Gaiellaceae bacterium]